MKFINWERTDNFI